MKKLLFLLLLFTVTPLHALELSDRSQAVKRALQVAISSGQAQINSVENDLAGYKTKVAIDTTTLQVNISTTQAQLNADIINLSTTQTRVDLITTELSTLATTYVPYDNATHTFNTIYAVNVTSDISGINMRLSGALNGTTASFSGNVTASSVTANLLLVSTANITGVTGTSDVALLTIQNNTAYASPYMQYFLDLKNQAGVSQWKFRQDGAMLGVEGSKLQSTNLVLVFNNGYAELVAGDLVLDNSAEIKKSLTFSSGTINGNLDTSTTNIRGSMTSTSLGTGGWTMQQNGSNGGASMTLGGSKTFDINSYLRMNIGDRGGIYIGGTTGNVGAPFQVNCCTSAFVVNASGQVIVGSSVPYNFTNQTYPFLVNGNAEFIGNIRFPVSNGIGDGNRSMTTSVNGINFDIGNGEYVSIETNAVKLYGNGNIENIGKINSLSGQSSFTGVHSTGTVKVSDGYIVEASTFSYTNYTTGTGTPTMGTNCPASVTSAPYTWVEIKIGTATCYIPAYLK